MSDVVHIPVGTGTSEGINSAYLVGKNVVVDPGPPTEKAWSGLQSGIRDNGSTLQAVDHVFVTHWHTDHAGLACRLAEKSNATIHMHADDAPLVGDYAAARKRRLEHDATALRQWGVPETQRQAYLDGDSPSPLPKTYDVQTHEDGDIVAGLRFIHTPGHTKGHTSFGIDGTVLLGDLLLPTYTPNVGGSDTRMDDPLAAYLSSIDRVNAYFDRGEPGHGTTMVIDRAVAEIRFHHRDRAKAAFYSLDADGKTPWAVARDLFGEMNGIHAKFGAGEAAAHLRRLAALDIVERLYSDDTGVIRYRPRTDTYPAGLNLTP